MSSYSPTFLPAALGARVPYSGRAAAVGSDGDRSAIIDPLAHVVRVLCRHGGAAHSPDTLPGHAPRTRSPDTLPGHTPRTRSPDHGVCRPPDARARVLLPRRVLAISTRVSKASPVCSVSVPARLLAAVPPADRACVPSIRVWEGDVIILEVRHRSVYLPDGAFTHFAWTRACARVRRRQHSKRACRRTCLRVPNCSRACGVCVSSQLRPWPHFRCAPRPRSITPCPILTDSNRF